MVGGPFPLGPLAGAPRASRLPRRPDRSARAWGGRMMTSKRKRTATIAHHEAGHAVVAYRLHRPPSKVTIVPNQISMGRAAFRTPTLQEGQQYDTSPTNWCRVENNLIITMAGPLAQPAVCTEIRLASDEAPGRARYRLLVHYRAIAACEPKVWWMEIGQQLSAWRKPYLSSKPCPANNYSKRSGRVFRGPGPKAPVTLDQGTGTPFFRAS
jgi:Peptidase family M41